MQTLLVALASASLLTAGLAAAPTPAQAQAHGGGGRGGGGSHAGGGFHGGGSAYHGGGYHGGGAYHGGGYRGGGRYYGSRYYGGRYYAPYYAGAFGFALGSAFAAPWYDYDYPPADSYSYAVPPPPPDAYDDVPDEAPPPQACGAWSWDASQSAYFWTPCATEGAAAGPPIVGRRPSLRASVLDLKFAPLLVGRCGELQIRKAH